MTDIIATDAQKQEIDGIIDLFDLTLPNGTVLHFYAGFDETDVEGSIHFRDFNNNAQINEYVPFPIIIDGLELTSDGSANRPSLTIANVAKSLTDKTQYENNSLIGQRITRRRTLVKYLDNGSGNSANPPVEFPKAVYILDRISNENPVSVTFEVAQIHDLQNIKVPRRKLVGKYCTWVYKGHDLYTKGGCTWQSNSQNAYREATDISESETLTAYFFDVNNHPLVEKTWLDTYALAFDLTANYGLERVASKLYTKTTDGKYWVLAEGNQTGGTGTFLGTPSSTNVYWKEVFAFTDHDSTNQSYAVGDLVRATLTINSKPFVSIWECKVAHNSDTAGTDPAFVSSYWTLREQCSKTLEGCKCRFHPHEVYNTSSNTTVHINSGPNGVQGKSGTFRPLPFGSFPTTSKF